MGTSVQPDPTTLARIQANVAKMRAKGATDDDVASYLAYEDGHIPAPSSPNTDISLRNLGRSFTQGATFGFGDELGLTNRDAEKAFKTAHPVADFMSKLVGGALAPAAAMAAAPEALAGAGGAALLGGTSGLLNGIGEGETTDDRIKGGLLGAGIGAVGGAAGAKLAEGAGVVGGKILDRMNPARAVGRASAGLLDDPAAVAQRMNEVNQLAPGGASVASTAIARDGTDQSRFLAMTRGAGVNPAAAGTVESQIVGQRAALDAGKKAIGAQMDKLAPGEIPITPKVREAMNSVKGVLGSKAPSVPPASATDLNPLGLEKSIPFEFDPAKTTMSLQEARDALSRLRYLGRQYVGVGVDGITKRDINEARAALQDVIYSHRPDFAPLDRQYAKLMDQEGATEDLLTQIQRSRGAHAGNDAYGATAGSLGGSLPSGSHGVIMRALDHLLTNKAGAADAVARLVTKPGNGSRVADLLGNAPAPSGRMAPAIRAGLFSSLPPALKGLLFDEQP